MSRLRALYSRGSARRLTAAALLSALALTASACQAPRSRQSDKPISGGTLRVAVRDLATLDPAKATGRGSALVLNQIFDPLTRIDRVGNPIPSAASKWETSPDGKTWTFHIAPATFHDGAAVTAWDFKFSFDRITSKALASDAAFQLEPVSGFKAARIDGTAKGLAGVVVADNNTLRITLDKPFYDFPMFLAHPALGPISQKVLNKNPAAFADAPVGNGPFKIEGPRSATGVRLVRFDGHRGATAYLNSLDVSVASDPATGWRQYLDHSVDVTEIPASSIESGRGQYGPEGFTPFWAAVYYGPNLKNPKFSNPDFRRALSLAVDRGSIAHTVYGGTKMPAVGLIPRGIPGFADEWCAMCRYDPAQARALIAKAFGAKPPPVVIDHLDASPSREVAAAIASNLKDVGLTVSLQAHDSASYLRLLQSGKQELAELGWLAEIPSADGFLAQQLRTGSPNNQVGFADPLFDGLIDRARAIPDPIARRGAYRDAEKRALDLMPLIPIVFFRNHVAIAPKVHDLTVNGSGLFDAASVWIAKA
ncbi:MAG: peptide ABC transporter substrate-binding protein [Actinomycetota bacterium]